MKRKYLSLTKIELPKRPLRVTFDSESNPPGGGSILIQKDTAKADPHPFCTEYFSSFYHDACAKSSCVLSSRVESSRAKSSPVDSSRAQP